MVSGLGDIDQDWGSCDVISSDDVVWGRLSREIV